jgi:hypothetical protein
MKLRLFSILFFVVSMPVPAQSTTHYAYGDFISTGLGATSGQSYLNLLATAEGATLLDFAAGNATACSVAAGQVFANSLPTTYNNSIFTVLVGANDAYTHGAGASEANFNTCQQAALSWLALPAQYKVTAQSASCVKTGNWQVFGPLPQSEMFSQSNGATMSCQITTNGGPLYIYSWLADTNGGQFSYSVDGGSSASVNNYSAAQIGGTDGQGILLTRVSGLSAATHTVLFRVTSSSSGANSVMIFGLGSPAPAGTTGQPTVYVGGLPYQENNTQSADTSAYNSDVISDVAALSADGLNVKFVNVRNYLQGTSTDMTSTLVPNNTGHQELETAFAAAESLTSSTTTPTPTPTPTTTTTSTPITIVQGTDPTGSADSTAAFKTAIAATASGTIAFAPGTYTISSTLVLTRNQQLAGGGAKGSVLICTMVATPCVVVGDTAYGPNNYGISTLRDFTLMGQSTTAAGTIGVYLGGDPAGAYSSPSAFADFVNIQSVRITGFYAGLQMGNNAYANKIERSAIFGNNNGIYYPPGLSNSGEAEAISDSSIFNNSGVGINLPGGGEWFMKGSSFDYNGIAGIWSGGYLYFSQCHFEEPAAPILSVTGGYSQVVIRDSEFLVQNTSGTSTDIFNFAGPGLSLTLSHLSLYSNYTIPAMMNFQGNVTGSITDITAGNIAALGNTVYSNPNFWTVNTPWNPGVMAGSIRYTPVTLGSLGACNSTAEGTLAAITDAQSQTVGVPVSGGGSYHVMAYCNGTSWTVR